MDLYEYQARELLEEQGIPTPKAIFAQNSHEVAEAADQIGYPNVIKAQVKIGHRGQAGGVKLAKTRDESILASEDILPMTIHKHKVSGVLVAEAKNILHEYYVSISVDRSSRDFDVLATANGGTEVEEIAKEHPESVKRLHIDALDDLQKSAIRMTNLPSRCARWTPRSPLMTMHRSAMMVGNVSPIRFMSIHMSKKPANMDCIMCISRVPSV